MDFLMVNISDNEIFEEVHVILNRNIFVPCLCPDSSYNSEAWHALWRKLQ